MKTKIDEEVVDDGVVSDKDKQKIIAEATRRGLKIKRQKDVGGGRALGKQVKEGE